MFSYWKFRWKKSKSYTGFRQDKHILYNLQCFQILMHEVAAESVKYDFNLS